MGIITDLLIKDDTNLYWKIREKYLKEKIKLLRIFYFILAKRLERRNNAEIGISFHDRDAQFASKPNFPHGLNGIIISRKSTIGKNATILQQVTIGTKITTKMSISELKGPIIGDNCYIGAGAKIIGNIKIGNNVLIGANAVVINDVPDNCTVVGVPGKIVQTKNKYVFGEGERNANC